MKGAEFRETRTIPLGLTQAEASLPPVRLESLFVKQSLKF